jgi:hypothetical protein
MILHMPLAMVPCVRARAGINRWPAPPTSACLGTLEQGGTPRVERMSHVPCFFNLGFLWFRAHLGCLQRTLNQTLNATMCARGNQQWVVEPGWARMPWLVEPLTRISSEPAVALLRARSAGASAWPVGERGAAAGARAGA